MSNRNMSCLKMSAFLLLAGKHQLTRATAEQLYEDKNESFRKEMDAKIKQLQTKQSVNQRQRQNKFFRRLQNGKAKVRKLPFQRRNGEIKAMNDQRMIQDRAERENQQLRAENLNLKKQNEEQWYAVEEMKRKNEKAKREILEMEDDIDDLKKEKEKLHDSIIRDKKEKDVEIKAMNDVYKKKQKEKNKKIKGLKHSISGYKKDKKTKNGIIEALEADICDARNQIDALKYENNKMSQDNCKLNEDNDKLNEDNGKLSEDICKLSAENDGLNDDKDGLKRDINGLNEKFTELNGEVQRLTENNGILKAENGILSDEIKACERKIPEKTCWQMDVAKIGNHPNLNGLDIDDFNGIWYQYEGFDWTWLKPDCINEKGCTIHSDDGELDFAAHTHSEYDFHEIAECEYRDLFYNIADVIAYCFDGLTIWREHDDQDLNTNKVMTVSFVPAPCPDA